MCIHACHTPHQWQAFTTSKAYAKCLGIGEMSCLFIICVYIYAFMYVCINSAGTELKALFMQGKDSPTELHSYPLDLCFNLSHANITFI
jgi:hypothetical protein